MKGKIMQNVIKNLDISEEEYLIALSYLEEEFENSLYLWEQDRLEKEIKYYLEEIYN